MTIESSAEAPSQFDSIESAMAELDRRDEARKAPPEPEASQDDEEVVESSPEQDEETPELSDEDGDEDEVATEESEKAEETDDQSDLEEIEYEGQKFLVPPELKGALLRNADYTQKTQALARDREQVQAAAQQTAQTLQALQQQQAVLAQFYQAAIGEPPSIELAQRDPQTYLVQRELHEQRVKQFQALMGHGQQLTQQQQQMMESQQQQYLQRELQALHQKLPELRDETKRREFTGKAVEVAAKYGFSEQEVLNAVDHRSLLMLRDLMALEGRKSAEKTVKQKMANVPPKTLKPAASAQTAPKAVKAKEAKAKFLRSDRSLKSAMRYLDSLGD